MLETIKIALEFLVNLIRNNNSKPTKEYDLYKQITRDNIKTMNETQEVLESEITKLYKERSENKVAYLQVMQQLDDVTAESTAKDKQIKDYQVLIQKMQKQIKGTS